MRLVRNDHFKVKICLFFPPDNLRDNIEHAALCAVVLSKKGLIKVAQDSFQHLYWVGRYNHSLSLDATTMVSKNFSIIGEHVAIIFLTQ